MKEDALTEQIYLSSPDVTQLEEEALLRAFRSGWVAPVGPELDAFESEFAARVGAKHAVALGSGTAALHLALLGVGVSPGDVVITATLTFIATANPITYLGATPYFVDCDPETGNLDPNLVEEAIVELRAKGARIAALLPVDLLGKAADYTRLTGIAEQYGIPLLCDAAESLGASHAGNPVGSFGRASAFSFNGNKIITTSGGGMLVSNDEAFIRRAKYLSTQARLPVVHYEHIDVGYNYRLSNLSAALGRAQLERLEPMMARRREIRQFYRDTFSNIAGVELFAAPSPVSDQNDNCWLTSITIDPELCSWTPDQLRTELARNHIESRPLWKPMHLQPVFADMPKLVNGSSEQLFERGLTLPSGSALTDDQLERIQNVIQGLTEKRG